DADVRFVSVAHECRGHSIRVTPRGRHEFPGDEVRGCDVRCDDVRRGESFRYVVVEIRKLDGRGDTIDVRFQRFDIGKALVDALADAQGSLQVDIEPAKLAQSQLARRG